MLFNKSNRFKNSYLIVMVAQRFKKIYERYEYEIYDEVRKTCDEKGSVDENDIQAAVKSFRELVAADIFDAVEREYENTMPVAENMIREFYGNNTGNIKVTGPKASLLYSIVIKMVKGDDFDFREIKPLNIPKEEINDYTSFEELAGVILNQFEEMEAVTIRKSLEVLVDDGTLESYPDYE